MMGSGILVSYSKKRGKKLRAFAPQKNVIKKGTEYFIFSIGGRDSCGDGTSFIERFDLSKMEWDTANIDYKMGKLNRV